MTDAFLTLDEFIPYRLSFTAGLVSDYIAGAYESWFGISVPEWRVLAWVAQSDGITQQGIRSRTRMDKAMVSRATIALLQRDLLKRRPSQGDKRSHLLALSPAGATLYAQIAPRALDMERRILSRFSRREIDRLVTMLVTIDRAVGELMREEAPQLPR